MIEHLRTMMLIRAFEQALIAVAPGSFQLLSAGEEAVAVGIAAGLRPGDQLLTSGRSIGPALACGLDPKRVMAECIGKVDGYCKGQGGRGHLAYPAGGLFGAHAVVAGNLTVAAGVALALQARQRGALAVCIFGDGACGSGALHETMNIAALWRLPLVLVCNNNGYSISTRSEDALAAAHPADLARVFGIRSQRVDGMDVRAVTAACASAFAAARDGEPAFVECQSYRFNSHSTASRESRPADEVARWRERCPIEALKRTLASEGILGHDELARLEAEVRAEVDAAAEFARRSANPDPAASLHDVG